MKYILKLYVTGTTVNSQNAIENLNTILNEPELKGKYELEVIDVLKHPKLAEDERILATPALHKKLPLPIRLVIGDLSDKEKVLFGLDLVSFDEINAEQEFLREIDKTNVEPEKDVMHDMCRVSTEEDVFK